MNIVILSGNLGRDPESRFTTSGKKVVNFSLAVNDGYGENKKTYWIDIVCWDKQADTVEEYLSKGSKVLVEGRMQVRTYEKDGKTIYKTEVVAYRVEFLDPAERRETVPSTEVSDEDIPF